MMMRIVRLAMMANMICLFLLSYHRNGGLHAKGKILLAKFWPNLA
jgi:hypothetical protein